MAKTPPRTCPHSSTHDVPIMDGKGNVIGAHQVCNECGMTVGTRMK